MPEQKKCPVCGKLVEELIEFQGRIMCPDCLDELTVICSHCSLRIYRDDAEYDGNIVLCQGCYDYSYTRCSECNALIHIDNAFYEDGNDDLCSRCYDELNSSTIKNYNYKPEPIFYGSGSLFMGELEIDKGGEDEDNANELIKLANLSLERIYCKHDGSIQDGFEIVSHPMTLEYHLNELAGPV